MMTEHELGAEKRFVPAILPWIIAAGAAVFFGATLSRWVTFGSLLQVAKASGWSWQPDLGGPLCWLVMYPLRWLPASLAPLGVNLFSMTCAALTLAVLARSVALLPHDRTQEQRGKADNEMAILPGRIGWLPPILAVMVCALQLTFWENATSGSGQSTDLVVAPFSNHCEMLDLLLFAYVIRCLLEFRITASDAWLFRASLIYGLGVTGNWAMVVFFPVLVVALLWLKKTGFFNTRFLGGLALWCLAGLSLYLLLPVVQSFAQISHVPFWTGLRSELILQKSALAAVYQYFSMFKQEALLLALTSLLPLFIISTRWASSFGDNSRVGIWTSTFMFHVVHGLFLGICIWVALDPSFSPRSKHYWMPCLTLAYLGALCVGYFSGYFLLLFSGRAPRGTHLLLKWARWGVTSVIWLLLIATPAMLISRNLPQIRVTNGPMLSQYASSQADALPAGKGIILCDDPRRAILLQSWLSVKPQGKDYVVLDCSALASPDYHRYLARRYGDRWPVHPPKDMHQRFVDMDLIALMSNLAISNRLYYLHPSFGYYFELFDPEPHGLVYRLNFCSTNTIAAPALTPQLVAENEAFWAKAQQTTLESLLPAIAPHNSTNLPMFLRRLTTRLHLEPEVNRDAIDLVAFYSRALDWWGVQLQRGGALDKAQTRFNLARDLNPDNIAAEINLESNHSLQIGQKLPLGSGSVEDRFGRRRRWDQVLSENGPFDDAAFCFRQGVVFSQGKLFRQAAHELARVQFFAPEALEPRLLLAKMNVLRGFPMEALRIVGEVRAQAQLVGLGRSNLTQVLLVETAAHLDRKDVPSAEGVIRAAMAQSSTNLDILTMAARVYLNYGIISNALSSIRLALEQQPGDTTLLLMAAQIYASAKDQASVDRSLQMAIRKSPQDENLLAMASQIYLATGLYSNVVAVSERQIQINPANSQALVNQGYAWLQLGSFDQAITHFTRAMGMDTNHTPTLRNYAQLNRAVAYLRKDDLADARRDYEAIKQSYPGAYQVYYGLQEIAYRKKLLADAARYCQLYLTYAPTNTDEAKLIRDRLKELQPGSR